MPAMSVDDVIKAMTHPELLAHCLSLRRHYDLEVRKNQELIERMSNMEDRIYELMEFVKNPNRVR